MCWRAAALPRSGDRNSAAVGRSARCPSAELHGACCAKVRRGRRCGGVVARRSTWRSARMRPPGPVRAGCQGRLSALARKFGNVLPAAWSGGEGQSWLVDAGEEPVEVVAGELPLERRGDLLVVAAEGQ